MRVSWQEMWNTYITELEESRNINFPFQYCQFMGLMLVNALCIDGYFLSTFVYLLVKYWNSTIIITITRCTMLDAQQLENVCKMTASTVPYLIHPIHITGVCPVTVVYWWEDNPLLKAFQRCQQHVSRVKRVDKVRWKRVPLFLLVQ